MQCCGSGSGFGTEINVLDPNSNQDPKLAKKNLKTGALFSGRNKEVHAIIHISHLQVVVRRVVDPCHFGTDQDLRIRASYQWIQLRILHLVRCQVTELREGSLFYDWRWGWLNILVPKKRSFGKFLIFIQIKDSYPDSNPGFESGFESRFGTGFESGSGAKTNFRPDPDPKPDPKLLFQIRNIATSQHWITTRGQIHWGHVSWSTTLVLKSNRSARLFIHSFIHSVGATVTSYVKEWGIAMRL